MAGFKNPFRRNKIQHPDGLDSTYYTAGITFDGGAEHLAYHNDRPHPLLTKFGGFIPRRQLSVITPQVVYQLNALLVSSIIPGIVAGQMNTQALLASGELSNTPNNNLINNALFGAVQS
jgi:hypothetical protein